MTPRPRLTHMTRMILLAFLFAALTTACTTSGSTDPGSEDKDAEAFKTEMDTEAKSLLPDLMATFGGELNGMQATFYERSGFGLWDYVAEGVISRPLGTVSEKLDKATEVLEQHGYVVERDDKHRRVSGTRDTIGVIVQAGMPTTDPQVTSLNVRIANVGAISEGDDYAENASSVDYLAYLE